MEKMKDLQPKIKALEEKYKDKPDKQEEKGKKILELYQQNGVNPLSGCLSMLVQLPIMYGIFALLRQPGKYMKSIAEVSSGKAVFLGINLIDPAMAALKVNVFSTALILPVLSGITMYWQQKISTANTQDPSQNFMMTFFPLLMFFFSLSFPPGLNLYFVVTNVLSIAQVYWMRMPKKSQVSEEGGNKDANPRKNSKND